VKASASLAHSLHDLPDFVHSPQDGAPFEIGRKRSVRFRERFPLDDDLDRLAQIELSASVPGVQLHASSERLDRLTGRAPVLQKGSSQPIEVIGRGCLTADLDGPSQVGNAIPRTTDE